VVYRLPGVGRDGSDVIAKRCFWQIALDERAVYEVLGELPRARLAYYGFVAEPACEFGWLFIEDARGDPWNPDDAVQRQLAARWLAGLHTASSRTSSAARLPDRDLPWFLSQLFSARRWICGGFSNPALAPEARPVLDGMLRLLAAVEASWPQIETACAEMPRALVHGDFAERNVRIRYGDGEARVLAFDWEIAGWGLPAVDLPNVDLSTYAEAVRADWPRLDLAVLGRFAQLGNLLRGGIAATSWAAESLTTTWPHRAVRELAHYQRRIAKSLAALSLAPAGGIS
jgi:aminoglycoside phosphotransferase (APT) family kinase protein